MRQTIVRRLFWLSLFIRGLDGLLEVTGSILLLAAGDAGITRLITWLTAPELAEDPRDLLANAIVRSLSHFSANTRLFMAAYLLGHGAIKVFFVAGLWREKLWAFPTALSVISVFVVYQLYRFPQLPSLSLLVLTIIDLFVIAVIWREYQFRKRSPEASIGP